MSIVTRGAAWRALPTLLLLSCSLMLLAAPPPAAGPQPPAAGPAPSAGRSPVGDAVPGGPAIIHLKYATFDPGEGQPALPPGLAAGPENRVRLVQVRGPLGTAAIASLEEAGALILGYVPDFTYLADVPGENLAALRALPVVRWVGDYHPAYKIQRSLLAHTEVREELEDRVEVNVLGFGELAGGSDPRLERLAEEIARLGGEVTAEAGGFARLRATLPVEAIPALARRQEVRWIDRWTPPRPDMDHIRPATGATTAHTGGFDGAGIVGELKDNGIDQNHPDFGNLVGTYGGPVVDAHGTCTFGIVFSDGTESAQALGMMPAGSGVFCDWYVERYASVENLRNEWGGVFQSNSWSQGDYNGDYNSYSEEDDEAIVDFDVLIFQSASNSNYGVGAETISNDSAAKNNVCVGAIFHQDTETLADDQWEDHGWGSTPAQGPAADGRIKPDLCAVFDWIYTTDIRAGGGYASGNYYDDFGGTSGACPITAGSGGLVYDMFQGNHFGNNPSGLLPHAATVKALLVANAHQYALTEATRYQQGWGLVQPGRVYEAGSHQLIVDGGQPLGTGESWSAQVTRLSASDPLKISLVWTDPAGEASASRALINDLDLQVTAPDGSTVYYGNQGLVSAIWSTAGGSLDRVNNVENVFIQSPADGPYTIEVTAYNVAIDNDPEAGVNQAFSLVASMVGGGGGGDPEGIVTGPGPAPASPPRVRTFDPADTSTFVDEWTAYGVAQYGVNVACGDLDGDGDDEVLSGPGPGAVFGPHVRGFSGEGTPLAGVSFLAYGTYKFGVNVAAGDLDGDGMAEIVTGAGPGAVFGPHVRGWNVDGGAAAAMPGVSFLAYGTNKWGVNVACGDIDGDGNDEIVTGAGPGAVFGPHVRGWNVDGGAATAIPAVSFFAYGTHKFGVNVACGDLDGDGMDEILTGPGPGGMFGAQVRGWNYDGVAVTPLGGVSFTAYAGALNGVRVAAADVDGDGVDEILTMPGPDPAQPARARGWNVDGGTSTPITTIDFDAYGDLGLTQGGKIAGGVLH